MITGINYIIKEDATMLAFYLWRSSFLAKFGQDIFYFCDDRLATVNVVALR